MTDTITPPKPAMLAPKRLALLDALRKPTGARREQPIVPVSHDQELPLSFAQQRLWFLYQLYPGSPLYNISGNIWFSGALDIAALQRSVNEIVRRHDILRTTFVEIDGAPRKVIARELTIHMPVIDIRHMDEPSYRAELHRIATAEVLKPFDLARGPLLRMTWLRLRDEESLVLFSKHHIVSDGWSVGGFLRELATLYEAFSSGKPSPLPELAIQHSDYAHWQRNWLTGDVLEDRLAFWKKQLAGAPSLVELPSDRPRPPVQSFRGGWFVYTLPLDLSNAIKAFSRHEEVTLFMTLLAAFQTLLFRYSGQHDIVVGSPISNRNRVETEALIGVVFNTLALRLDLSGDPTFRELVQRARDMALSAYANQDLPFEQLVEALQPERSLSHSPVFQVMFVLQNSPMPEFRMPNLVMKKYDFHSQTSKFDLTWSVDEKDAFLHEKEQPLAGSIEYSTDLFDAATIERMLEHFKTLIGAAMANPDLRLSQLPLLPNAERTLLLRDFIATEAPYPDDQRMPDLLRAQLDRTPDADAVRHNGASQSFRELHARANQLAHHLQRRGVGPDTVVAICFEHSPELVVAMMAVLAAGGTYLPLDPAYPLDRLGFMLADANAALVLTHSDLLDRLPSDASAERMCLDRIADETAPLPVTAPASDATPESLAYLIYTSGSTGRPKGVAITHRNAVNMLAWARDTFPAEDRAVVLAGTSVCFDLSIFEIFLPLAWGGSVVLARNVMNLPHVPEADSITLINTVPSVMTELLRQMPLPPRVRCVNLAGERLPAELVQAIAAQAPHVRIANLYGPSETTTYSTIAMLDGSVAGTPPIGRPVANTQVYLLDAEGAPVPIGIAGEVFIGGDGVARGYLNRPGLTADRFVPDHMRKRPGARLYRTGDLARWKPDGQLEYLGRNDHQVKVRGFRIELGEIEHVLGQHPAIRESVVVARTEGANDVRLVAYVATGDGELGDVRAFVRERLPEYMVPNIVVPLERLPHNANGKVDRAKLPDPVQRVESAPEMVPPRTAAERMLAEIWKAVLHVEAIGAHDDFFALGGHSLLATRVIARVRQETGADIPLRAMFEAPTLAGLARLLERSSSNDAPPARSTLRAAPRGATAPLSATQQRLWFLNQLDPRSTAYTIPGAFRLSGPLDGDTLRRALDAIVARHEALRTTFALVDRELVQEIHDAMPVEMPIASLRHLGRADQEAEVLRQAREQTASPFPLNAGPLLRVSLLALSDDEHVLVVTMHHIISDGWSIGIFLGELTAFYDAFAGGGTPMPGPLPVQYADFAIWQREWLKGDVLQAQQDYWTGRLAGAPPFLALRSDRARPAVERHRGARVSVTLPAELADALEQLGRRHSATLFMTLLAAWQTLLARCSGQTDIVVGAPIAGRVAAETEGLIGCFVNTLVLRADLSGNPSFVDLLGRVRHTALEAYAHQDVPFEHLVEVMKSERSLGYSPIIQHLFVLQNMPVAEIGRSGIRIDPIDLPNETSKLDTLLAVVPTPNGWRADLEYNVDLFGQDMMERMLGDFQALLRSIVAHPEQALGEPRPPEDRHTPTEDKLAEIWREVLRVPRVGIRDNFFASGGHSLLAVQLLVRIQETFQSSLELRSLFEAPTIAEMALLIDAPIVGAAATPASLHRAPRSPVVPLQTAGGGVPCVCVHPSGGSVFCYANLALELRDTFAMYGMEARGFDGTPPQVRIESMASSYVDAIQAVRPEGPYVLAGWSLGGIVAFEMAQQLAMQGQRVDLLTLLDTSLVESIPADFDESIFAVRFIHDLANLHGKPLPPPPATLRELSPEAQLAELVRQAQDAGALPVEVDASQLWNQFKVFRANGRAMLAYKPQPYSGRMSFVRARDSADKSGPWKVLARDGLENVIVPGDHYSMLRAPSVALVAEHIRTATR